MKTYILRDPQSVQRQTAQVVETPDSQTEALVKGIGAAAATAPGVGEDLSGLRPDRCCGSRRCHACRSSHPEPGTLEACAEPKTSESPGKVIPCHGLQEVPTVSPRPGGGAARARAATQRASALRPRGPAEAFAPLDAASGHTVPPRGRERVELGAVRGTFVGSFDLQ